MGIDTNAAQLAAGITRAADELRAGLGVEDQMAAAMLARVRAPRQTGAYAASVRTAGTPPTVSLVAAVDYANIVEFGSRFVHGRRVLARAVQESQPSWMGIAAAGVDAILDRI